jgi:hypothetical protein
MVGTKVMPRFGVRYTARAVVDLYTVGIHAKGRALLGWTGGAPVPTRVNLLCQTVVFFQNLAQTVVG